MIEVLIISFWCLPIIYCVRMLFRNNKTYKSRTQILDDIMKLRKKKPTECVKMLSEFEKFDYNYKFHGFTTVEKIDQEIRQKIGLEQVTKNE